MEEVKSVRRKKVLLATDGIVKTGFGRAAKCLLEHLYHTQKYDLVHFCIGTIATDPNMDRTPWKSIGAYDPAQIQQIKQQNPQHHEQIDRQAGYGHYSIEKVIKDEKPDIIILMQDPWSFPDLENRDWFNKTTVVFSITVDSLPLLPSVIATCSKSPHYWPWAEFATKALHKIGHKHAKTVMGPIDSKSFFRLPDSERAKLRKDNGIAQDCFLIVYTFRNQLRKSVPNILEGFKLFKNQNPKANTKLLFHTNFSEGWNVHARCDEFGIDKNDVLTTYVCRNCNDFEVKPFTGQDQNCKHCKAEKSQVTTQPAIGVSDQDLNKVYNLCDAGVSAFTSGGQEYFNYESLLTEIPIAVTNYSCGEDICNDESGVFPLDYAQYREPGTEFIKASTYPSSIAKQLQKIYNLSKEDRRKIGQKGRNYVLSKIDIKVIGKIYEDFIDSRPFTEHDFKDKPLSVNPDYIPDDSLDDEKWIESLYKNILGRDPDQGGFEYWKKELSQIK